LLTILAEPLASGGIASSVTGDQETDLGGGNFRPRKDLHGDLGGRGRSKRAGMASPEAGTNLTAAGVRDGEPGGLSKITKRRIRDG
jgi:hypothetical protein